jgi:hypothetical protein
MKDGLVHTVHDPDHECEECRRGRTARIHNVIFEDLGHSGVFAGRSWKRSGHEERPFEHAAFKWLPYLWDIEPADYLPFLRYCSELARTVSEADHFRYSLERSLLDSQWGWTQGMTLEAYIYRLLETSDAKANARSKELVPLVVHGLWNDVQDTLSSMASDGRAIFPTVDPRRSLYKAIVSVVTRLEGVEAP